MKRILLIAFSTASMTLAAQENKTQPAFQRHEISLSGYGLFYESVNQFSSSLRPFEMKYQALNGLQYRYHLNERNAIRASFSFYHNTHNPNSGVTAYNYNTYGLNAGFEHLFCSGKWRPYVFGELSYGLGFTKTDFHFGDIVEGFLNSEPQTFTAKTRTNQGGVTLGAGLKYFCCKHFFVGIESSGSFALYRSDYRTYGRSPFDVHNKNKGNVFTLAPLRFVSIGVSF